MAASWPVALRELERGGEKPRKGQLGGETRWWRGNGSNSSCVAGKWRTFTRHTLSLQIRAFFFLSKSIPVCRHNITIFLKVFCNHFCLKKLQRDYGRVYRYNAIK